MKTLRDLDLVRKKILSPGRFDNKGNRTRSVPQSKTDILTSKKKVGGYQRNMKPYGG